MKDTSLVTDGSSCTRIGGRPEMTEARKVEGTEGALRERGMSEKNAADAKREDLLEKILDSGNLNGHTIGVRQKRERRCRWYHNRWTAEPAQ